MFENQRNVLLSNININNNANPDLLLYKLFHVEGEDLLNLAKYVKYIMDHL